MFLVIYATTLIMLDKYIVLEQNHSTYQYIREKPTKPPVVVGPMHEFSALAKTNRSMWCLTTRLATIYTYDTVVLPAMQICDLLIIKQLINRCIVHLAIGVICGVISQTVLSTGQEQALDDSTGCH